MSIATHSSTHKTAGDAARVVRRALVLAAMVCRGSIEIGAGQSEAGDLHNRLLEWLTQVDLWDDVEPSEETILHTPLGQLEQEDVIRVTWYVEGLAVLAWALKQFEFPRIDQKVDPYAVADAVWFLSEDAEELIHTALLRDAVQLKACEDILYAIHVRLRDFIRNGRRKDFTGWIEKAWIEALGLDATQFIVDNDLAIDGKTISAVEDDRVQECASLTYERHRAIIWLVEGYSSYSQTPVDT